MEYWSLLRYNKDIETWEGNTREPVEVKRGLSQGCPLSPLLFLLYLRRLKKKLQNSGRGFDLSYHKGGQNIKQALPALVYADDIN